MFKFYGLKPTLNNAVNVGLRSLNAVRRPARGAAVWLILLSAGISQHGSAANFKPQKNHSWFEKTETIFDATIDINAATIAQLRGLGGFSISPNGKHLAFIAYEPNVDSNSFDSRWFVTDLSDGGLVSEVGDAGKDELFDWNTRLNHARGLRSPAVNWSARPKWSPQGESFLYLKQTDDQVQIWQSFVDGAPSRQVTFSKGDVIDFEWSNDGNLILFSTYATREELLSTQEADARSGFRVDAETRWSYLHHQPYRPIYELLPEGPLEWEIRVGTFTAKPRETSTPNPPGLVPSYRVRFVELDIEKSIDQIRGGQRRVLIDGPGDSTIECSFSECEGYILSLGSERAWLDEDGQFVLFWTRDPESYELDLLRWNFGSQTIERLLRTRDLYSKCDLKNDLLYCLRKGPTQTNQLVSIHLVTGEPEVVVDPNPDWKGFRQGRVQYLNWSVDEFQARGILFLPPDHNGSDPVPLVVNGYGLTDSLEADGGVHCPTHAMASEGLAVLLYEWDPAPLPIAQSRDQMSKTYWTSQYTGTVPAGSTPFKLIQEIVRRLDAERTIDSSKVGICGFSNGMNPAAYGLINSDLFSAASLAWVRWNPSAYYLPAPNLGADILKAAGMFNPIEDQPTIGMAALSLSLNANHVDAPILVQASVSEYYSAMQSEALRRFHDAGKPMEMFVFPNELHTFFHPAHVYSRYKRNIQWFDYWLNGNEAVDPIDADQYERWSTMGMAAGEERASTATE